MQQQAMRAAGRQAPCLKIPSFAQHEGVEAMTTNQAHLPNDESLGDSRRPSAGATPVPAPTAQNKPAAVPRKPFVRRALGFALHKWGRVLYRLDLLLLPWAAWGQRSAALYY